MRTEATDRVLSIGDVCEIVGVHKSTVRRMERSGLFPRKLRISPKRVGWRERDVRTWLDERSRDANAEFQAAMQ